MVQDLEFMKEITDTQAEQIVKDLKDQGKLKTIEDSLTKASLRDILKLYIKANYYDGDSHHESKVEEKQTSKMM